MAMRLYEAALWHHEPHHRAARVDFDFKKKLATAAPVHAMVSQHSLTKQVIDLES